MTETRSVSGTASGRSRRSATPARKKRTSPSVFTREVADQLRKVIWPTRHELITYTSVVIVFVGFIIAFVALLDIAFAKLTLAIFG